MKESPTVFSVQHREAVLDVEARRLAHTLTSYGVLDRGQLLQLAGAHRWTRGRASHALARAVERGLVRYLGYGFYAPPRNVFAGGTTLLEPQNVDTDGAEPVHPGSSRRKHAWISSRDMGLAKSDFEQLLELRTGLRRFLSWSDQQAKEAGLTPAKHQLLLAIKGHPDPSGPTIGDLADYLVLRHHSVVGLVDRAESDGLVRRDPDPTNRSAVRVTLTPAGEAKLDVLTETHLQEISHLAPTMRALWRALDQAEEKPGHPARRPTRTARSRAG